MTTHGLSNHRLNKIWRCMRQRCNNPNDQAYKWYGAKGVTVCAEWESSFLSFYNWAIANGYQDGLTLDRVKSDKSYEPSNCRWLTREENTRRAQKGKSDQGSAKPITFNGETLTIQGWADKLGISYQTLYQRLHIRKLPLSKALTFGHLSEAETYTYRGETRTLQGWANKLGVKVSTLDQRINRLHWPVERALTANTRPKKPSKSKIDTDNITAFGETKTLIQWSNDTGLSYALLYQRLDKGWPEEKALSKPVRPKKSRK